MPEAIIIMEAVITGACEEMDEAITPARIGGSNCPSAWTEELIPRISPWIFWSADLEIRPEIFAIDRPLQIAKSGAKMYNCHQEVAKNMKPTASPAPIKLNLRICLSEN